MPIRSLSHWKKYDCRELNWIFKFSIFLFSPWKIEMISVPQTLDVTNTLYVVSPYSFFHDSSSKKMLDTSATLCIFPAETSGPFQTSRISRCCLDHTQSLCTTKNVSHHSRMIVDDWQKMQKKTENTNRDDPKTLKHWPPTARKTNIMETHNAGAWWVFIYLYIYIYAIDAPKERGYGCGLYNFWSPGAKRVKGNGLHIQWNSS